jgi:putative transposase
MSTKESQYIHKSHNVSVLIYHIVCPSKYRKVVFDEAVEKVIRETCIEIAKRYEIVFLEIGFDKDHAHFLVQSVPMYSPTKLARIIKSILAREILKQVTNVKKQLWGGEFWSKGFFISTVGKHGDEKKLMNYVRSQGVTEKYKVLHQEQLKLL